MSHPADHTTLADRHYVTLILRLTLDRGGRLIQGELVDTAGTLQERFIGRAGLSQAVQAWFTQQEQVEDDVDLR